MNLMTASSSWVDILKLANSVVGRPTLAVENFNPRQMTICYQYIIKIGPLGYIKESSVVQIVVKDVKSCEDPFARPLLLKPRLLTVTSTPLPEENKLSFLSARKTLVICDQWTCDSSHVAFCWQILVSLTSCLPEIKANTGKGTESANSSTHSDQSKQTIGVKTP